MDRQNPKESSCETCICCGNPIPEGRMICISCEKNDTVLPSNVKPQGFFKKKSPKHKKRNEDPL